MARRDIVDGCVLEFIMRRSKGEMATNLSSEVLTTHWWIVLGIPSNEPSPDVFHRQVLYVETDIVTGNGLGQSFMVHLHRLHLL